MIRKLAMVGLLVIAGQGSLSQIFVGLCMSVVSLGAQIRFEPFKHPQDNYLKLVTEAAIFLTLLVAFALKAEPAGRGSGEMLSATAYDILLVGVFTVVLPAAFVATIWSEQGQMRQALGPANVDRAATDANERRRALKLFQVSKTWQIEKFVIVLINACTFAFGSWESHLGRRFGCWPTTSGSLTLSSTKPCTSSSHIGFGPTQIWQGRCTSSSQPVL